MFKYTYTLFLLLCSVVQLWAAPATSKGILDLRAWDFEDNGIVQLDGEWSFAWRQFLPTTTKLSLPEDTVFGSIHVPAYWNDQLIGKDTAQGVGYGTYLLKVLLQKKDEDLSFHFPNIGTAAACYVNGKLLFEAGVPGKSAEFSEGFARKEIVDYRPDTTVLDIVVHVSNFENRRGGIWQTISLGKETLIRDRALAPNFFDIALFGSILIMGLYHLGIFALRKKDLSALYFALFCLLIAIRVSIMGEVFYEVMPHLPFFLAIKIEYLTFYLGLLTFSLFVRALYPSEYNKIVYYVVLALSTGYSLTVIVLPSLLFSQLLPSFQLITVGSILYVLYVLVVAIRRKREGGYTFFLGLLILFATVVNDILYQNAVIETENLIHFGMISFIFSQAYLLSSRFSKAYIHAERLSLELNYTNQHLEELVNEKTRSLTEANSLLRDQKEAISLKNSELEIYQEEIKAQRDHVTEQRDKIVLQNNSIKDSILYARRIQSAILPPKELIGSFFPDFLLFYKPRDIVSGDFYWMYQHEHVVYLAAADCTGHGVPGAFMSMLGVTHLNEIVNRGPELQANQILGALREQVKASLRQTGKSDEAKDGIDIALCVLDTRTNIMQFAGAHNPMYLVRGEGEQRSIRVVKGDKMPIGIFAKDENPFANNVLQLKPDDTIYLATDGFQDQFGGQSRRKYLVTRFRELLFKLSDLPMERQQELMVKEFEFWRGRQRQIDDILVLGFKVPNSYPV